jgi:hypothetical protein
MTRFRDIAELVRAPAALSVPGDAVAGAAAARVLGLRTAGLSAAAVCLYWAGMAANDWADRDIDAKERPERPIPSGRVSPSAALGVAAGLSAAGLVVAGLAGGRRALRVAVPLTALVWGYDLGLKHTSAGPAAMAGCRALDVMLGASGSGAASTEALVVAAHTYTVTVLSKSEVTGATPALPRATLAATAAVAGAAALAPDVMGKPGAIGVWREIRDAITKSNRIPVSGLASSGMPPTVTARSWRGVVRAGLAAWYGTNYGRSQLRAVAEPHAGNVRAAVAAGITGLPALQGALIARAGAPGAGAAVAIAAPAGALLARRVSPT